MALAPDAPDPRLQALVGDRYQLLEPLGAGGFGRVYLALQRSTDQLVAIKMLDARELGSAELVRERTRRWRRELRLGASLSHPHIARLIDSSDLRDGIACAVFEYIEGETLAERLQRGPLEPGVARRLMAQVLDALAHAHAKGVVHRDLNPANIMLARPGLREHAVVLDFGLGTYTVDREGAHADDITRTGEGMGTPRYAAPEQLRGERVSPLADLYSFALVFLEALTGVPAVPGSTLQEVLHEQFSGRAVVIPPDLELGPLRPLLQRALSKDPRARTVSTEALLRAIEFESASLRASSGEAIVYVAGRSQRLLNVPRSISSAFYERCGALARAQAGEILAGLGERILLGFAEVEGLERAAVRALRVALALAKAPLPRSSERSASLSDLRLAVQAGVGEGDTLLGDPVDDLVLLQDAAPEGRVVASAEVAATVADRFSLGAFVESGPRGARIVVQEHPDQRATLALDLPESAMAGRSEELAMLVSRWKRADTGAGQVVVLSGEAGIGKSRLAREMRRHVDLDAAQWVVTGCSELTARTPFAPLQGWLRSLCRLFGADELRVESLMQIAESRGVRLAKGPEVFAFLLGGEDSTAAGAAEELREQVFETLLELFVGLSAEGTLILFIEDLQWCDPSTLSLLEVLRQQCSAARLLLLATHRVEFDSGWPSSPNCLHLSLGPLSEAETGRLLLDLMPGQVAQSTQMSLVGRSGGNPLFVEELTKAALERGWLRKGRDGWEIDPAADLEVPDTLEESVGARIDRLRERDLLELTQFMAALGMQASWELLLQLGPMRSDALREQLDMLVADEVLHQIGLPPRSAYSFRHDLIRAAAYATLEGGTKTQLHRRIREALSETSGVDCPPELLARHAEAAGMRAEAVRDWAVAGKAAARRFAHVEAVELLRHGLEVAASLDASEERDFIELDLQIELFASLGPSRGYGSEELDDVLARAQSLCEATGSQARLLRVLHGLARTNQSRARFDLSLGLSERVVALARAQRDGGAFIMGHLTRAFTLTYMGRFAEAAEGIGGALDAFASVGDTLAEEEPLVRETVASGRSWLGYNCGLLGDLDAGLARIIEAREHSGETGLAIGELLGLTVEGELLRAALEVEASARVGARMIELASQARFPFWTAIGEMMHGWAVAAAGDPGRGLEQCRQGLARWDETGARHGRSEWIAVMADVSLMNGQNSAAAAFAELGLQHCERQGDGMYLAELWRLRAEASAEDGQIEAARIGIDNALETARSQRASTFELRALLTGHQRGLLHDAAALRSCVQAVRGADTRLVREAYRLLGD